MPEQLELAPTDKGNDGKIKLNEANKKRKEYNEKRKEYNEKRKEYDITTDKRFNNFAKDNNVPDKNTLKKGSEIPKEFFKLNDDSKIKEFLEKQDNTIIIKEIKTKHSVIDNKINILNNEYKEITNYINNVDRNKLQQNKEYLNDFFAKFDKRKEINKQIEQLRQDKITETLKSISFSGGGKIDVGTASKNLTNVSKRLQRDLEGIINKDLIKDSKLSIAGTNRGRQYFSIAENKLYLTSKTDRATAIHEAMHWLEENNKDVGLKSIKFLEYRTRNDNVEKLKDLTGIKQYKDNEVAKKDKFFSPYCGKIYKNEGKYYASEILSMGMQELINNPLEFYKNDPEYVNFILGVIRNKI